MVSHLMTSRVQGAPMLIAQRRSAAQVRRTVVTQAQLSVRRTGAAWLATGKHQPRLTALLQEGYGLC